MKMPKNVDFSKSINREKVIEPSIANNEKNIECPPLAAAFAFFSFLWVLKLRIYIEGWLYSGQVITVLDGRKRVIFFLSFMRQIVYIY